MPSVDYAFKAPTCSNVGTMTVPHLPESLSRILRPPARGVGALFLWASCAWGPASAQETSELPPGDVVQPPSSQGSSVKATQRFRDPEDGRFDVTDFLEHPFGFLPVPIIVTEPAVGYGAGLAGMFLRPREEEGAEGWARPNISGLGAFATENGTQGAFAGDASRWMDGRLRTLVGAATGKVNLDFYGVGSGLSSIDQKLSYSLQFSGAVAQINWQLAPKSPWAVGMRYVFAEVDPTLRSEPLLPHAAERARVKVSAPTAILEFDTRDNIFTPTRGVYAETSYLAAREALGSSDDFERLQQIAMGWLTLSKGVILGARGNYTWSSKGTPFFLRPFVQLRGVPAMRYQGDQMASVEVEARLRLEGRWSGIVFGGYGGTRTERENTTSTKDVVSGGLGARYNISRKFGLDVGVDVARSPDTTAVYLVVGNSWFRP